MNIIEIENLSHRFANGVLGIDDINLAVKKGEFLVIAGRNGSGKTTLLRHLNGLLLPNTGTIKLAGIPVSQDLIRARQVVGMVFQDAESQIVGETVYDDVAFGPENLCLARDEIKQRVQASLEAVGLTGLADQRPHTLSGGEKRRVNIAVGLLNDPDILYFDEPPRLDIESLGFMLTRLESANALYQLNIADGQYRTALGVVGVRNRYILEFRDHLFRSSTANDSAVQVRIRAVRAMEGASAFGLNADRPFVF